MLKKIVIGALLVIVALSCGLFLWARSIIAHDGVRTALAQQLSTSLGQPVEIGSIAATIYPRVTVNLGQVTIGRPARIRVDTLHVGTDFRALLSRRIEHARLELSDAHVELPLPPFTLGSRSAPASSAASPVTIVSIDLVSLRGVEISSGGRTLSGDLELVPEGNGVTLKKVALAADKSRIDVGGQITDLSGPVGNVTIKAGALNFDQLIAFASDFARGTGPATAGPASASAPPAVQGSGVSGRPAMNIGVSLEATRASIGALTIEGVKGKARLTPETLTLAPVSFGVFGGRYDGTLVFSLAAVPDFRLNAALTSIDTAAAAAFAGSPGTISGRLSGTLNLAGRGMDSAAVTKTARGTARVDVVNGAVKNLGLIRTVIVATSGRADSPRASGSRDEPFTKLGATFTIANGSASTQDLRLESKDILLAAAGTMRLDGTAIDLPGRVQLSDDLSKQAGRDLVRYTQDAGRVTLPAVVTGSASAPQVRIDVASVAKRALTNRANEEAEKALRKGLGGLFKK